MLVSSRRFGIVCWKNKVFISARVATSFLRRPDETLETTETLTFSLRSVSQVSQPSQVSQRPGALTPGVSCVSCVSGVSMAWSSDPRVSWSQVSQVSQRPGALPQTLGSSCLSCLSCRNGLPRLQVQMLFFEQRKKREMRRFFPSLEMSSSQRSCRTFPLPHCGCFFLGRPSSKRAVWLKKVLESCQPRWFREDPKI